MPLIHQTVDHSGRLVVELYLSRGTTYAELMSEDRESPPAALLVRALVDTGASRTQVDLSRLEQIGVIEVGEVEVFTASSGESPELQQEYFIDVSQAGDLPGTLVKDLRVVGSAKLGGLRVDMLLGRDVLDHCLLVFDGRNRRFSLSYNAPIDAG
jgi:hypothetical protein